MKFTTAATAALLSALTATALPVNHDDDSAAPTLSSYNSTITQSPYPDTNTTHGSPYPTHTSVDLSDDDDDDDDDHGGGGDYGDYSEQDSDEYGSGDYDDGSYSEHDSRSYDNTSTSTLTSYHTPSPPYPTIPGSKPHPSGYHLPSGYPVPSGYPLPSGVLLPSDYPLPTGFVPQGARCEFEGQLLCNGAKQFGLCNFGGVVWRDVAAGMVCVGGEVVGE